MTKTLCPHDTLAPLRALLALLISLLAVLALMAPPARADDRDLLRTASQQPYIFILFDNTGSMRNTLQGTLATNRDDDPASKLFQAKSALYSVLDATEGVNFGFATFPNQDNLRVTSKSFGNQFVNLSGGSGTTQNCVGWEPNGDINNDRFSGYTFKWANSTSGSGLEIGDIVPMDWGEDNVSRIQERLAPNLALGETTPDFGVERYFRDSRRGSDSFHRLRDNAARPFVGRGLTPLEGALDSFADWYEDWEPDARDNDPDFDCKQVFVLLLTDGFETCGGFPTNAAAKLLADGVRTYVVGFAVANPALNQIADAGGTDEAFFPEDEQELVDALTVVFGEIKGRARTFASAAVPSVVGTDGNQVFHTSFNPVSSLSVWPGRLDHYTKPVPLIDVDGAKIPNYTADCGTETEACHGWNAGEELVEQAPTLADIVGGNLKLGPGIDERRVFYAEEELAGMVPAVRHLFEPPLDSAEQMDLYGPRGMGLDPADFPTNDDFLDAGREVIEKTLVQKEATIIDRISGAEVDKTFVLGDIFHSDPTVIDAPNNFQYFAADVEGRLEPCGPRVDGQPDLHVPYPCFVEKHQNRRRMLIAGSNDGQLHVFDAGQPFLNDDDFVEYSIGTGREIFAFSPRGVLPTVRSMADDGGQQYAVDGTVTIDDFLLGPDPPGQKEWRTALIGGLREGGRSYYALDITQPDEVGPAPDFLPIAGNYTAGCIDGGGDCKMGSPYGGMGPFPNHAFPEVLWEFTDATEDGMLRDEDGNGAFDLGFTWSQANTGRIKVIDGTDEVVKYVAVFAGGMDPEFKRDPINDNGTPGDMSDDFFNPNSGNFLYMVEIETGDILYKRRLDLVNGMLAPGSAPSSPAAVDLDRDSYLDTIYVGTTAGYLFKADIGTPAELETYSIDIDTETPATTEVVTRVRTPTWEPFPIFNTEGRPIYFAPSVVFVSDVARYALAFGTGDREDLWNDNPLQQGRFYVFLDEGLTVDTSGLPFTADALEPISAELSVSPNLGGEVNFLTDPISDSDRQSGDRPGWVLVETEQERLLNKSFVLAGVLFLNTFIPSDEPPAEGVCGSAGDSRIYTLFVTNGDSLRDDNRYIQVPDFVTAPFVEATSVDLDKPDNPEDPPNPDTHPCQGEGYDDLRQRMIDALFPPQCDFANYDLNVTLIQSDAGLECVAPVPVCVIGRNWKEF